MLETPALILDAESLHRNADRMAAAVTSRGAMLRPHVKTSKCIEVVRLMLKDRAQAITVSTLKEADYFLDHGLVDQIYAVGITPNKLERVSALRAKGADLKIILDSVDAARAVAEHARRTGDAIPVLVEIDSDGHRGGVQPQQQDLIAAIADAIATGATVAGVLTHAGGSYAARTEEELRRYALMERDGAVAAAMQLRAMGHEAPIVSIGSTPTALSDVDLAGVTEVRAGVYIFFDLVMAGVGVCDVSDIALSVLASVIAVQPEKNQFLVDAGWMALSRDRGTSAQAVDQGYGLVCDRNGVPFGDLIVESANQEHGIVRGRKGSQAALPPVKIGDLVRILPNHACATAAAHDGYNFWNPASGDVTLRWPRIGGW